MCPPLLLWFAVLLAAVQDEARAPASTHVAAIQRGMRDRRSSDSLEREAGTLAVVTAIDHLTQDFPTYDEKTQKDVVRVVAGLLDEWVGEEDDQIHFAAAGGLSEMGPLAAQALRKTAGVSHLERNVPVRCLLIEALGKHRDPKDLERFFKLLDEEDVRLVTAACDALAEYSEADSATRKRIFKQVLKVYGKAHDADQKAKDQDPIWHERLLAIEVPMNRVLDRMTAANRLSVPEWREWYAQNQHREW